MALKLMEPTAHAEPAPLASSTQDILMINYPVFFSPDAIDYADFANAGALTGNSEGLKTYFIPSRFKPFKWRMRQGWIAYQIASQSISSPLGVRYFSMVPFLFGPGRAVKYSARPCPSASAEPAGFATDAPDFLRKTTQALAMSRMKS
jgi:hypothetical protein